MPIWPGDYYRSSVGGASLEYDLAGGATTLPSTYSTIYLTGTAGASFNLTLADGTYLHQRVSVVVRGSTADQTIDLLTEAAVSISSLNSKDVLAFRWTGATWDRVLAAYTVRDFTFTPPGDPTGVVIPSRIGQEHYDTTSGLFYKAVDLTSADWRLIGGGAGVTPTVVESDNPHDLTAGQRAELGIKIYASANSVDFDVPLNVEGSWIIYALDEDDGTPRAGCTVSVEGNAGSVNGSAGVLGVREIAAGGVAVVTAIDPSGSAPSVTVVGNIFEPDSTRGATTLSTATLVSADHQRSITITGTQTISLAVASIPAGFTAVYWASGANRTIDGLDADFVILAGGACTVHKNAAGALVAVGSVASGASVIVLDAA